MKNRKKYKNLNQKFYKLDKYQVNLVFNEFEKNGWAHYPTWKLEYAAYKVQILLNEFIEKNINMNKFIENVQENMKYLMIMHKYYSNENDNRSGEETYGYKDLQSIRENICYISDRWKCQYRLRWLIDLI